ncbi:hypothetical protein CDG81_18870 [Actinopolyspora erythraea]|uniref:DUF2784 domain-containing protein n=1 Tax=Actinopolyspora erythraea TaxID=414996 RepID=A0A099D8D2_9ACTN|nr:hypothetical protein [Actinopolyspora erythraea]ASU79982.1 hypothetical protein CDG81_18870 [Actinopolyspora erythraea]KGI82294.1 hypothetical protein IL38_06045 [Actinopolyspora erythraea]
MEDFAIEFTTLLLFATPLLILVKILQMLLTQRLPLVSRGYGWAMFELVTWLLVATLDSHTLALWSGIANQPEDVCEPNAWKPSSDVYIESSSFFDYPVATHCVWSDGHTMSLVPWQLNAATLLFLTAAIAVTAYAAVRAHRRRGARQHTTR